MAEEKNTVPQRGKHRSIPSEWNGLRGYFRKYEDSPYIPRESIAKFLSKLTILNKRMNGEILTPSRKKLLLQTLAKIGAQILMPTHTIGRSCYVYHLLRVIEKTPFVDVARVHSTALLTVTNPKYRRHLRLPPVVFLWLGRKIDDWAKEEKIDHLRMGLRLFKKLCERQSAREKAPSTNRPLYARAEIYLTKAKICLPEDKKEIKDEIDACLALLRAEKEKLTLPLSSHGILFGYANKSIKDLRELICRGTQVTGSDNAMSIYSPVRELAG